MDVGLAADIGSLARVPKVAGNHSLVHELAYTGRNFSAAEAEKMGFVSRVVEGGRDEVTAAALEVAKLIAEKSPVAVAGTKHLLLHSRDHTYLFQLFPLLMMLMRVYLQRSGEFGVHRGMEQRDAADPGGRVYAGHSGPPC